MDKTDIILVMHLLNNSRMSNRELAEKLNLSVNAVHKRIQTLKEQGVIRKFTAKASLFALSGVITIQIYGVSTASSFEDLPEKIHKNDSIYWLALAGGSYLYIGAYLRNLSALEPLMDFIKKEAKMPNPIVGIVGLPFPLPNVPTQSPNMVLSTLDRKIIHALRNDSRKAISDIAEELGVSAKTIRRRLSNMADHYLIDLSLEWFPDASNDILAILHLHLKPTIDKKNIPQALNKYIPNLLFYWSFSNLSNELMAVVWTNTMKELKEIQERFAKENLFESIIPNILYVGYIFETWRDDITCP
jgi:DNA-binding Lrp family transcriptional regulator